MKATHLLSLLVTHETLLATAETSGYGYDDPAQLTFTQPDTRPRPACEYEYEYESANAAARHGSSTTFDPLQALQDGLEVMQSTWFQVWVGTWPTAIDWTAAVLDTHLVSSLTTLSKALESPSGAQRARDVENDLNRYFSQNVSNAAAQRPRLSRRSRLPCTTTGTARLAMWRPRRAVYLQHHTLMTR